MRKARDAEPKLDRAQREGLAEILRAGPRAAGWSADLWTGRRVAEVVRGEFGVRYNPRYVPSLLRSLGFAWRKPRRTHAVVDLA
jgi:transposase